MTCPQNKQEWIDLAEIVDALRVFPRIFMLCYCILFLYSGFWAFGITELTTVQGALVGTIITAGAAWFGLYNATGRSYEKKSANVFLKEGDINNEKTVN